MPSIEQQIHNTNTALAKIEQLHWDMAEMLRDIHTLKLEIYHLRQRTRIFIDRYLEELGSSKKAKEKRPPLPSLKRLKEENLTKLYRSLAKKIHPDQRTGSHDAFLAFQRAYQKQDLKKMYYIWVGQQMLQSKDFESANVVARLTRCQDELFQEFLRLTREKQKLVNSDGYTLREKIVRATLSGTDIVKAVKREFKSTLALPQE